MKIPQQLTSRIAAIIAVAALAGTSAFADSRHSKETHSRGQRHDSSRQTRSADRPQSRRGNDSPRFQENRVDSRSAQSRSYDRNRDHSQNRGWNDTNRSRSYDSRSNDSRSHDSRGGSNWRGGRSYPSNRGNSSGNRQPFYARGRVERILPFNGGFRIWIGGAPFPFFVPQAYYYRNHFRIGLTIGLGGYYNPLGYYDYYDGYDRGYNDNRGYIDSRANSGGTLRGTVESVDYRSNTFVIRNEATGSFVTIEMRQRLTDVKAGDYVELSGDWTRSGVFEAYTADLLDDRYRR